MYFIKITYFLSKFFSKPQKETTLLRFEASRIVILLFITADGKKYSLARFSLFLTCEMHSHCIQTYEVFLRFELFTSPDVLLLHNEKFNFMSCDGDTSATSYHVYCIWVKRFVIHQSKVARIIYFILQYGVSFTATIIFIIIIIIIIIILIIVFFPLSSFNLFFSQSSGVLFGKLYYMYTRNVCAVCT